MSFQDDNDYMYRQMEAGYPHVLAARSPASVTHKTVQISYETSLNVSSKVYIYKKSAPRIGNILCHVVNKITCILSLKP